MYLAQLVLCALLTRHYVSADDDEVKALMKVKPDGGLLNTAELVEQNGFKSETHKVTTDDGYILTVFRVVPNTTPSAPVLLQHGLLSSSDCWVTDPGAMAFTLSAAGLDVWMSNARGNAYSRTHENLNPEEKPFWDFSVHEMATKDVPTVIDYILRQTNSKALHYVGHSLGTTMGLVMASTLPDYNSKLYSVICFAPIVSLSKIKMVVGPDGMMESMASSFMDGFKNGGKKEYFPRKDFATNSANQISCDDMGEDFKSMCDGKIEEASAILGGPYIPAGTSLKVLDHVYQMGCNGEAINYNFGKEENQKAYGTDEPPKYTDAFNAIAAPVVLWSATEDQLITAEDVNFTASILPNLVADNRIEEDCFDHVTFLFATKKSCFPVRSKLYQTAIELMKKLDSA